MSCGTVYAPQLRARGFRMTPQRMAILHVLQQADNHLSPAEIFAMARNFVPGLSEPTVYRTLEFLAQNGLVQPVQRTGGHLAYQIAEADHHHIICRNCGREIQVPHTVLNSLYETLEAASGFRFLDRHLTFWGLCSNCQQGRR